MKRGKQAARILSWRSLLHLLFAAEIIACTDVLMALLEVCIPAACFHVAALVLWLAMNRFCRARGRRLAGLCLALPCALLLCGLLGFGFWKAVAPRQQYVASDSGKSSLYANQTVMLIVPHEDDDINLAGGIIDEYVIYGSDVYVVFLTNGDFRGIGETRINEALRQAESLRIPENHVIFLGYGDRWQAGGPHIYNAEPGAVMVSHTGRAETYGTAKHPAYHDGQAYTIDNLLADVRDVILEYKPDTILCCDYDQHADHRATGLIFERAMGQILREESDYAPTVLKGFAYNSAFNAAPDYFNMNILSTRDIYAEPQNQWPRIYAWEDRVRFPINPDILSRSLFASLGYRSMEIYASQKITRQSASILNGDKVFWHRRTDSLCYNAVISASSGDADRLNDFMLLDTNDLLNQGDHPYDGTWIPDAADDRRTITVRFEQPRDIAEIVLYDNPSPEDNILNAEIRFDNGSVLSTGALNPTGIESVCAVNEKGVSSFEIVILESEGQSAGFTEIEAYSVPRRAIASYVQLMDSDAQFVYDYITPDLSGEADFLLYRCGDCGELDESIYSVTCDSSACSVAIKDGRIHAYCPEGTEAYIYVTALDDPFLSDTIHIRNPGRGQRAAIHALQRLEQLAYALTLPATWKRTAAYRTLGAAAGILKALM